MNLGTPMKIEDISDTQKERKKYRKKSKGKHAFQNYSPVEESSDSFWEDSGYYPPYSSLKDKSTSLEKSRSKAKDHRRGYSSLSRQNDLPYGEEASHLNYSKNSPFSNEMDSYLEQKVIERLGVDQRMARNPYYQMFKEFIAEKNKHHSFSSSQKRGESPPEKSKADCSGYKSTTLNRESSPERSLSQSSKWKRDSQTYPMRQSHKEVQSTPDENTSPQKNTKQYSSNSVAVQTSLTNDYLLEKAIQKAKGIQNQTFCDDDNNKNMPLQTENAYADQKKWSVYTGPTTEESNTENEYRKKAPAGEKNSKEQKSQISDSSENKLSQPTYVTGKFDSPTTESNPLISEPQQNNVSHYTESMQKQRNPTVESETANGALDMLCKCFRKYGGKTQGYIYSHHLVTILKEVLVWFKLDVDLENYDELMNNIKEFVPLKVTEQTFLDIFQLPKVTEFFAKHGVQISFQTARFTGLLPFSTEKRTADFSGQRKVRDHADELTHQPNSFELKAEDLRYESARKSTNVQSSPVILRNKRDSTTTQALQASQYSGTRSYRAMDSKRKTSRDYMSGGDNCDEQKKSRICHSLSTGMVTQRNEFDSEDPVAPFTLADLYDPTAAQLFEMLCQYALTPPRPIISKESNQIMLKDLAPSAHDFQLLAKLLSKKDCQKTKTNRIGSF